MRLEAIYSPWTACGTAPGFNLHSQIFTYEVSLSSFAFSRCGPHPKDKMFTLEAKFPLRVVLLSAAFTIEVRFLSS